MPPGLKELTDKELDRAYIKAAGAMLAQILLLSRAPNSAMQMSLKKLDVEAARLADDDEKIKAGNPFGRCHISSSEVVCSRDYPISATLPNQLRKGR